MHGAKKSDGSNTTLAHENDLSFWTRYRRYSLFVIVPFVECYVDIFWQLYHRIFILFYFIFQWHLLFIRNIILKLEHGCSIVFKTLSNVIFYVKKYFTNKIYTRPAYLHLNKGYDKFADHFWVLYYYNQQNTRNTSVQIVLNYSF